MADATRIAVFQRARNACVRLLESRPASTPLRSVVDQLDYLLALETGGRMDRALLTRLHFHVIAAREVESIDMRAAFLLYDAYREAKRM